MKLLTAKLRIFWYTMSFKKTLPALFAIIIITSSSLLQQLHLSSCHCQQCHNTSVHRLTDRWRSNIPFKQLPSLHSRHPATTHHHDSRTCPICQMYSSVKVGFNLPDIGMVALVQVIRYSSLQPASVFFPVYTRTNYSPRAPPFC